MTILDFEAEAIKWLTKSPMSQAVTIDKDSNNYLVVLFKGKNFDYLQIEAVLVATGQTTASALEIFLRNLGRTGDGRPRACIPVRLSLGETDKPFQIVSCGDAMRFDFTSVNPADPPTPKNSEILTADRIPARLCSPSLNERPISRITPIISPPAIIRCGSISTRVKAIGILAVREDRGRP